MVELKAAEVPCFINRWHSSLTTLKQNAEILFFGFYVLYLQGKLICLTSRNKNSYSSSCLKTNQDLINQVEKYRKAFS